MPEKRIDVEESAADREIAFTQVTSALVLVLVLLFVVTTPTPVTEHWPIRVSICGNLGHLGSFGGGDTSVRSDGECEEGAAMIRSSQAVQEEFDAPQTMAWDEEADPKQFAMTATFADEDGKTRLTMRMVFVPAERDQSVREYGSIEGGKQTLKRLTEHLSARFAAK